MSEEEERLEDIAHYRWLGRQDALHALVEELFAYDEGADIYLLLYTPGVDGRKMGRLFEEILWDCRKVWRNTSAEVERPEE